MWVFVLPFLPVLAGLVLSAWRFEADDAFGGLASCLGGMLLMMGVAMRMPA